MTGLARGNEHFGTGDIISQTPTGASMNPTWRSFLESADGIFDGESAELLNFGDAAGELKAAQTRTVLVPLTHLALLQVQGEDAKTFLHSQFTNDFNHLTPGKAEHAAWCTAKGRMQASFLAWREGDSYVMTVSSDLLEATQKRLKMFVLRAKVKIEALSESRVLLGLSGPQAAEALGDAGLLCPAAAMTTTAGDHSGVIRLDENRYIVSASLEAMAGLWQKLSVKARPAGLPVWRWLDIQAGLPLITAATKEEFVPQMADFEKIGGVSFHKGCYPGQEIVARTQYLGKVKRHLYRVRSDQPLAAGDELHSPDNPDQTCGKIVFSAPSPAGGFEALAVLQSNFAGNIRLRTIDGPPLQASAVNP
jgi:tRNA-modifying protein YgfZ